MNILKYQAFLNVVETGSLTKAAQQMGYSQPGISHMIDSLESEIGFPLLVRSKEKITPTVDGEKILYYCHQIVQNQNYLQETVSSIRGILQGDLKIGAYCSLMSALVPHAIHSFSRVYPQIKFYLYEVEYGGFQSCLHQGTIDLGFMNDQVPKSYAFIPLLQDRACVIMRDDHPLVSCEKLTPASLNGCNFIMPVTGFDDIIHSISQKADFSPSISHYAASDTGAIALTSLGLGISVISSLQTNLLPEHVIARELDGNFGRILGITVKSLKHLSPAIQEFIRISKETVIQMFPESSLLSS